MIDRHQDALGGRPGRLDGVRRSYGAVRAVDDVTLEFPRGGWTAVMGPSGSGKSTLPHCAAGLERVDAGQVLLGDTDLTAARDRELTALRRTRIGFVFQSFNLIGSLTAAQNVALPLRLAGRRPRGAEVRRTLDAVGLLTGFLPTELFLFTDAGVAWTSSQHPVLKYETNTTDRVPVISSGVGLRMLLSYIPLEFYWAKPYQRPGKGLVFGFNIIPGW